MRRIRGWIGRILNLNRNPTFERAGIWDISWAEPPISTPIPTPRMAGSVRGASTRTPSNIPTLNQTGANEAAKNLRWALRMPMSTAAMPITAMNGNRMRVSLTVRASLPGSNPLAKNGTYHGASMMPRTTTTGNNRINQEIKLDAKAPADPEASADAEDSCSSVYTGTMAVERAPSASSCLRK